MGVPQLSSILDWEFPRLYYKRDACFLDLGTLFLNLYMQSMTRVLQRIHQDLFLGLSEHMVPLNPCVNHKFPYIKSTIWRVFSPPFSDRPV